MIVAGVQGGAARLQGKARYRKTGGVGGMLGMYPAGAASRVENLPVNYW